MVLTSDSVWRFCRLASSEFQTDGAMKLKQSAHQKISNYVSEFSKAACLRIRGCVMFDI